MEPQPLYKLKGDFFKTLGHPARVRILELLAEGTDPSVNCSPRSASNRRTCPSSWVCSAGPGW